MASQLTLNMIDTEIEVRNITECTNAILNQTSWKYTRLPKEYQELTYIASSSSRTQYINTGVYPKANVKIEGKIMAYNYSNYDVVIGQTSGDMNTGSIAVRVFSGPKLYVGYGGHRDYYKSISFNSEVTFNTWNCGITVNGSSSSGSTISFTPNSYALWMFGGNNDNALWRGFNGRIYYMKIYNDNILVRHFIPARRKSDSVLGMYDLVNRTFYTNSGSGSFTAGSEVN